MSLKEAPAILFNESLFFLHLQGFIPEAALKELLTALGKKIFSERSSGLIVDCQQSKIISVSCQNWIVDEWLRELRNKLACPYRIAVLAPSDYFGKYSIDNLSKQIQQKHQGLSCQIVADETEAKKWITNF